MGHVDWGRHAHKYKKVSAITGQCRKLWLNLSGCLNGTKTAQVLLVLSSWTIRVKTPSVFLSLQPKQDDLPAWMFGVRSCFRMNLSRIRKHPNGCLPLPPPKGTYILWHLRPHAWLVPIAPSVLLGAARLFVLGISKGATDSEITIHAWNSHNRLHLTIQYWYALVASRCTITIFTENCFFRMLQFRQCAQCAPLQPCQDTSKKQSKAALKGADRASREWVSC